jgi:ADP-heptose:LPS heptosyltransferase
MLQSDLGFQVKIMEWDSEAKNLLLQSTSGVIDATGDGMADNCKTIRDCDLFVSVDSWTKYVANWFNTPQIIIVPDLRKNYTPVFSQLTATDIARGWFVGLLEKPSVKILGLEKRHSTYNYSLENINLLTPNALLNEAQAILGPR